MIPGPAKCHRLNLLIILQSFSLSGMAVVLAEVHYGAGRHAAYLTPAIVRTGLKLNFVTQPMYLWGNTFTKISISLFILRLTPAIEYRWFLWGMITFMSVYTTVFFVTILLSCTPIWAVWDLSVKAKCFSPANLLALAYLNVCGAPTHHIYHVLLTQSSSEHPNRPHPCVLACANVLEPSDVATNQGRSCRPDGIGGIVGSAPSHPPPASDLLTPARPQCVLCRLCEGSVRLIRARG